MGRTCGSAPVPGCDDGFWVWGFFALPSTREDFLGLHPGPAFSGLGHRHGPGSAPRLKHGALPAVPDGSVFLGRAPCPGCLVFRGAGFALGPVRDRAGRAVDA